jgi:hypothetical protein
MWHVPRYGIYHSRGIFMNTRWKLAALAGIVLCPALLIPIASLADQLAAATQDVGVW